MTSTADYYNRLELTLQWLDEADYVIIGAGAGLSAAAGLEYSGPAFEREFAEWIRRYGITDLYSSSFYPFKTEEERWAYWARHIWFARFMPEGKPLYRQLLEWVKGKPYFVLTTNVDAQFEKSGFDKDRIFATQGDYAYLQARSGKPETLVYNENWVKEAMDATKDCRIPSTLVPRHPETGELMSPNLRCDNTFVEDKRWHQQAERCQAFVEEARGHRLLLLEFGVGFNTPSIIRFPFERLAAQWPHTSLIRFNRDYPQLMTEGVTNYIAFTEDLNEVLNGSFRKLRNSTNFVTNG
ncbi:MAG: Sir2 silent information regulator family NAD-dependent deacetylase [Bacteroidales bacterium]|nr:Sir2 silent information regulator family NAD-dependent deacetylase [Bacteroidales bacterium]